MYISINIYIIVYLYIYAHFTCIFLLFTESGFTIFVSIQKGNYKTGKSN